ncbi:hypothetical protein DJ568_06980 [Mucilaginibacter hurinus]|uniref:Uncharacterized protein n=1 Tax=Mucilaginibacter hurinus TaxID=2201324 RepID=A0A367GQ87_9SPHI|nr:hypothetical protein [Mucilaginibacter hurinus]RCH55624.1 hypothetical protein DJ568_06980 [Mucilaginibacter hurinus]
MEKTGISVLSLIVDNGYHLTEVAFEEAEEKGASETKEGVKEYWLFHPDIKLPLPYTEPKPMNFAGVNSNLHLAYFPSVPTPPPNYCI